MSKPVDGQENDLTPEALRIIADWLDTYDKMAIQYLDTKEIKSRYSPQERDKALAACAGKQIQEDLRRWADLLDTEALMVITERQWYNNIDGG